MAITISGGGGVGITIESDPTAVKLVGSTMTGTLNVPEIGNILNTNLIIDSYNDTGTGTHYEHKFTPFDGKFLLATNGGGLVFPDSTTQSTAGLPLTGGTLSGKVNLTSVGGVAGLNIGIGGTSTSATTAGDLWIATGGMQLNYRDGLGTWRACALTGSVNTFTSNQIITCTSTVAGLRITQAGIGNAIEVEDSATPDATRFVVDQFGKVGVGTAPDATAAIKVDGNGIKFSTGSVLQYISTPVAQTGTYNKEIPIAIDGVNYWISCRQA
jgi:hypothetical protein